MPLVFPGDAGAEVRHAGQVDAADLAANVQVHHLAAAAARGADQVVVMRVEEEIVEVIVEHDAARCERPRHRESFCHLVVVHEAVEHRRRVVVVAHFPDFGNVLERGDKALARRGVVHRRHARGLAVVILHIDHLERLEVARIEHHQRMRQVVRDHRIAAVARYREIARVDAGAHFGDELQVPDVVLGDPAVARSEIHIAAIRRKLRPAVQGITRREAGDGFELVAVQDGGMVIAEFDHHEQVERVSLEHRLVRQVAGRHMLDARCFDLFHAPCRNLRQRRVDEIDQLLDFVGGELAGECRHLRRHAAFADSLDGIGPAQAFEVARQERGPCAAETVRAVAGGAMRLVQGIRIGGPGAGTPQCNCCGPKGKNDFQLHAALAWRILK